MIWIIAAGIWGFAEATLFFIVPDVLLSAIALRSLRAALFASLVAVVGAMIGGALMYQWGVANPEVAVKAVAAVPAVGSDMMANARESMLNSGPIVTVLGPLSATPYKVYAVQASAAGIPLWQFLLVSPIARLPRFMVVSLLAGATAHWLKPRVSMRVMYAIWAIAWLIVYAMLWGVFSSSPG